MTQDIIKPFRHQAQLMALPFERVDIGKFFLIGGYGAAKTSALKLLTLKIIERYWRYPVIGALGAPTLTFLEKTLLTDLRATLNSTGSDYKYDAGKHVLRIGKMEIRMIPTGDPGSIYGHNLSFFLADEHDENSQDKAIESNKAIDERCRIEFPDGRPQFSVLATTAQGLKGVYRIVEAAKEQYAEDPTVKYALIRGRTEDNTTLKPSYIRRLKATYTPDEQEAYLEGKFVNLTAGRVYYAYDESVHFRPVAPVEPHETVYVGQDLNEGYSKASACVIRNRNIEIVAEFSFKAIGQAPRLLREAFPHNRIVWYPDNSGKPILGGYTEEIEHYGIETVYTGRNPSILDRIFIVNKLFSSGRMIVSKECKETSMALKTRQFDDKGVPEKGKGPTAPDHLCFRGDMRVLTERGWVRIDSIVPGDMVMTRQGPRPVLSAGITSFARPREYRIGGVSLWATPDHPVMTERGKVPIDELTPLDIVFTMRTWNEKPRSSMASRTTAILAPLTDAISSAERVESQREFADCTATCGNTSTGRFPMGTTSTTKTGTRSTMTRRILSAFLSLTTCQCTPRHGTNAILSSIIESLTKLARWPLNGTGALRAASGTASTPERAPLLTSMVRSLARIAERCSLATFRLALCTAQRSASRPSVERMDWTTKSERASTVGRCSRAIGTSRREHAETLAPRSNGGSTERPIPVYNLTVDGVHEYFVEGVLVSNCDSIDYVTFRLVQDHEEFMDLYELSPASHKEQ